VKGKMNSIGIKTVKDVYRNLDTINEKFESRGYPVLKKETLKLLKECCETTAQNTGHIVFAAGRAIYQGKNEYRIRVVHSTKHGKLDENGQVTTGVQEYYRRFTLTEDGTWTRGKGMTPAKNPIVETPRPPVQGTVVSDTDDEDDPQDDMEEDEDVNMNDGEAPIVDEPEQEQVGDELAGLSHVDVIAARMCF
jgi:hypothetical protein